MPCVSGVSTESYKRSGSANILARAHLLSPRLVDVIHHCTFWPEIQMVTRRMHRHSSKWCKSLWICQM